MEAELGRLHGYLGVILARGAQRACHMHADELTLAHVLGACMCDEDCAAHEVVVHAFADPETIELELTALSPGILVVGSRAALPFSTLAVEALAQARNAARGAGEEEQVETSMLLSSALDYLPPELSEPWIASGSRAVGDREPGSQAVAASDMATGEPLFRRFSPDAKRALSLACKAAHAHGERSISPARLVLACLDAQPGVGRALSPPLSPSRARSHLAGHTVDETPPPQRVLPPHPQLLAVLRELPQGGDSLDLLARAGRQGDDSLDTLMDRHRLTPRLLQRARAAFRDPDQGTHEQASS